MKDTVLLLTSCINPNGMKFTVLQDKEERKKQYIEAIKFYLANTKFKVVFCDNSGEDLSELRRIGGEERLEILSFLGNDFEKSLGKGYGEFNIIKYVFVNSRFIKDSSNTIKITGRLIVDDLDEVVKLKDVLFPRRDHFVFVTPNNQLNVCDSRCFFADNDFYNERFLQVGNEINDSEGYFFEHLLYDTIKDLPSNYIVSDFVLPLAIRGVSGTSGEMYSAESMKYGEKLVEIRNYCEYKKALYKEKDKSLYLRLSVISLIVRIKKAVFNHISR